MDSSSALRGWSFRTTGEGTFYWFEQPQDKSAAQEATTPLWFSLDDGMFYLFSSRDIGASLVELVYQDVDVAGILAGEPFLLAEFGRALKHRTGETSSGGRWAPARNGALAPADFVDPYPAWREELFADFDKDGVVTIQDIEALSEAVATGDVRIFVDGLSSDDPDRSARMDLDVIVVVAAYCPPECILYFAPGGATQTATINCDGCGGGGGGGDGGQPVPCRSASDCNDQNVCDGIEYCGGGFCGAGTPLTCFDNNRCTDDLCHPITGCYFPANNDSCAIDGNPCTADYCISSQCWGPLDGATCTNDQDACTRDVCVGNVCTHQPVDCDDGNACTQDSCAPALGCEYTGGCDDEDACTDDDCVNGECVHDPVVCDDNDGCTQNLCKAESGCYYPPKNCDEGDPCTRDWCEGAGVCKHWDRWDPPVDTCADQGWSLGGNPPAVISVNNDDDNRNGIPDHEDAGPVTGENDLKSAGLFVWTWGPIFPECTCEDSTGYFVGAESSSSFSVHRYSNQSGDAGPQNPALMNVYLSGKAPTLPCGEPLTVRSICCYHTPTHTCVEATDPVVVAAVTSLTWEKAWASSADLEPCPNNGGFAIFPDHLTSGEMTNPANMRRQVKLVAQIDPPISGRTVYFRVWTWMTRSTSFTGPMPPIPLTCCLT